MANEWQKTFMYALESGDTESITLPWNPLRVNSNGDLIVQSVSPTGNAADVIDIDQDSVSPVSEAGLVTFTGNYTFDGTFWNRQRGNEEITLLSSSARTSTTNSSDQTNYNSRGLHVIIDVTSVTATPSITPKIQGKDPVSGNYYDVLVGSAITTTGTNVIKVYPGIATVSNGAASDILPLTWRVRVEHADTDSITYSVGAVVVV